MVRSVPVSAIALVRAIKSSLAPAARQTDLVAVPPEPERAAALLRRRDFRRVYLAVAVSELGDAFQYIALMWFALEAGGAPGVGAGRAGARRPRPPRPLPPEPDVVRGQSRPARVSHPDRDRRTARRAAAARARRSGLRPH